MSLCINNRAKKLCSAQATETEMTKNNRNFNGNIFSSTQSHLQSERLHSEREMVLLNSDFGIKIYVKRIMQITKQQNTLTTIKKNCDSKDDDTDTLMTLPFEKLVIRVRIIILWRQLKKKHAENPTKITQLTHHCFGQTLLLLLRVNGAVRQPN